MKFFYRFLIILIATVFLIECARQGRPTGGPKDENAPIMVTANPPYESTNFKDAKIKIEFDEYIILKNLNKQLVISPPMKNQPLITPQGTPSKYIQIKILDTLKPNTTYTFNFGNAVQDNNENNKLESFKYVFSTGNYIDSLTLKGSVNDALENQLKKNISLALYKLDSTYNDSIIYKQKPNYVTSTIDSINFKFTNLQEGNYAVLALDEESNDYIFNPKNDKIGFLIDTISLPRDTLISKPITVFKEDQPYIFKRGREISKGKILFSYSGKQTNLKVKLLSTIPIDFKSFTQLEKGKDTLNYWFTPIEADSLNFIVSNKELLDSVTVRLRKKKIDSLSITPNVKGILHLNDTLFLTTNNPIITVDKQQFSIIDKDTLDVSFELEKQEINKLALLFKNTPDNNYKLKISPKAITDLYNTTNKDTLQYSFATKNPEDYGSISLNVQNKTQKPIIIELLSGNKLIDKRYLTNSKKIDFVLLNPVEYTIRAIVDENDNKKWDTGNWLQKKQPERIVYFNEKISLRANWTVDDTFTVK